MSLSENPMFGVMIGTAIGNNAMADAENMTLETQVIVYKQLVEKSQDQLRTAIQQIDHLRQEVQYLENDSFNGDCITAGVRGVVRELLAELRRTDPNHPLLDKEARDRVFDAVYAAHEKANSGKDFRVRASESGKMRDAVYGVPGATKSGPAKDDIKPNAGLRSYLSLQAPATDREKLLALVDALATELKELKPEAKILEGSAMRQTFDEFALNEAIRLDARNGRSIG